MKKLLLIALSVLMILSAGCGKTDPPEKPAEPLPQENPAEPVQPQEPETPETPETPAEPETPVLPETPAVPGVTPEPLLPDAVPVEPEGFVASLRMPGKVEGVSCVNDYLPLGGKYVAVLQNGTEHALLLLVDLQQDAVVFTLELPGTKGELLPFEYQEEQQRELLYYDGAKFWKVSFSEDLTVGSCTEYTGSEVFTMGEHSVSQGELNILIDGEPALDRRDGAVTYQLRAVLDDDRLLFRSYATDSWAESWGIYRHSTGETQLLTGMGQSVWGRWGDTLLVCRSQDKKGYDFVRVSLEDGSSTPLKIGHETPETAVERAFCDGTGKTLCVIRDQDNTRFVEVFDVLTGEQRYAWSFPSSYGFLFDLTTPDELLIADHQGEALNLWRVEF